MRIPALEEKYITFELVYINEHLQDNNVTYRIDDTLSMIEFIDLLNSCEIYHDGPCLSGKSKLTSIFNSDKNIYKVIIFPTSLPASDCVFVIADTVDDAINIMKRQDFCRDVLSCFKIVIDDTPHREGE